MKVWREHCRWEVREGLCEEVMMKLRFEGQEGANGGRARQTAFLVQTRANAKVSGLDCT